jgi:hypothetical protein
LAACAGLAVIAIFIAWATKAKAQDFRIIKKSPMYSYIAVWNIPRDQWAAKEKQAAAARKILDRAISNRIIVAYGFDENPLHDAFWLSMSKEGIEKVRDQFQKAGISVAPASTSQAAPPPISILISRYYNWRTTTCKNAYVHVGIYKIKPNAPPDAADALSKNFFGPQLEKMLSEGAIFEWETDVYANPKDSPDTFLIAFLSTTEEGLNKANDAVQKAIKSSPLQGPAFDSLVDVNASRDVAVRSYAVYQ